MFILSTIVLAVLLAIVGFDYMLLIFKYERLERDRNRAIARIARLKKLLDENAPTKD